MKILSKILIINFLLFAIACSSSEEVFIPMEKISDQGKIFSIGDFKYSNTCLFCVIRTR